MTPWWAAAALALAFSTTATAQLAALQIEIIEGEAGVHAPGSRSKRPLVVVIRDEAGRPVAGAAVSFHLPEEGPSGLFSNGLRTDVATTDHRGRAVPRTLQWNRVPGRLEMRILASKEQARAGTVSIQFIAEPAGPARKRANAPRNSRHGLGWALLTATAAAVATAGVLATR